MYRINAELYKKAPAILVEFYFSINYMKHVLLSFFLLQGITAIQAQPNSSTTTLKHLQQELAGTWELVSVDNIYPDGSRVQPYGEHPQGILMFDPKGNYSIQILKSNRPAIVSGDKNKCTPEESAALVQGSNSHFGKYLVDTRCGTITFRIEHAFFPNWEGTEQKRNLTYTGNTIKYVVSNTTQGGKTVIAEVSWRRVQ